MKGKVKEIKREARLSSCGYGLSGDYHYLNKYISTLLKSSGSLLTQWSIICSGYFVGQLHLFSLVA